MYNLIVAASSCFALIGNLDYFTGSFDIGVSVHACGVATDLVLKMCLDNRADFVSCPCCYGKVQENHVLSYPRSQMFAAKEPTFEVSDHYQSFFIRNCVISMLRSVTFLFSTPRKCDTTIFTKCVPLLAFVPVFEVFATQQYICICNKATTFCCLNQN